MEHAPNPAMFRSKAKDALYHPALSLAGSPEEILYSGMDAGHFL
jgi:hypothetical protein